MQRYFDIRKDVISKAPTATMFYLIGQGGCGKTYSCKKEILLNLIENDKGFIYIKRYAAEFKSNELNTVFADVVNDPDIKEPLANKYDPTGKYSRIHILQNGAWFSVKGEDENGKLTEIKKVGRLAAVSQAQRFKGAVYNDFNIIFFDEFISKDKGYIKGDEEPGELDVIIGTVAREGNPVKIFMCSNPDAPIEACPYLYPLKLDYVHLQENALYRFDTITPDGERIPNNVIFMKISNFAGNTYINKKAGYLFGTSAERVRMSGEVLSNRYIHLDNLNDRFNAQYELIVESPKITDNEYHVRFYVYAGIVDGKEPALVILRHEKIKCKDKLYCRYDKTDYLKRVEWQTWRLNIPHHDRFKGLNRIMAYVDSTQIIITDDDTIATLYEHIKLNG